MNFEIAPKTSEIQANWYDAKLYCFSLNIDGKIGWRLPTKEELTVIYESQNDLVGNGYWSSTECDGNDAWVQGMRYGHQANGSKNCGGYYVRAIRDLKDN